MGYETHMWQSRVENEPWLSHNGNLVYLQDCLRVVVKHVRA